QALKPIDVEELETHLRDQLSALVDAGLSPDEAFLVAVKRIGDLNALSREFALEHAERLWKQLVLPTEESGRDDEARELGVAVGLAVLAACAVKVPELFGRHILQPGAAGFYARNFSLFAFPLLIAYFVWKRRATKNLWWSLALLVAAAVVFA